MSCTIISASIETCKIHLEAATLLYAQGDNATALAAARDLQRQADALVSFLAYLTTGSAQPQRRAGDHIEALAAACAEEPQTHIRKADRHGYIRVDGLKYRNRSAAGEYVTLTATPHGMLDQHGRTFTPVEVVTP